MPFLTQTEIRSMFTEPDGIDRDRYIVVHYVMKPEDGVDISTAAAELALVASIGTVIPLPFETPQRRQESLPKIVLNDPSGDREGKVRMMLALPADLYGDGDTINQIMALALFPAEYRFALELRLEAIELPRKILATLPGPKIGVDGFRQSIGIRDRVIVGGIIKPRLGLTTVEMSRYGREALLGGIDFLVDDELVTDSRDEMAFESRIGALVDTAHKAEAASGEPKRVIANISSSPRRMLELAAIAEKLGVAGLLVNGYVNGFGSMQDLAAEVAGRLPIITCNIGIALLTRAGQPSGMSGAVLARLSRLAGADAVHTGASAADWHGLEGWGRTVLALRSELRGILPSIPVAAGGVNIGNAAANILSMGEDLVLEAGGGIFGYPGGPARAGEAFRALIDVIKPHMNASEIAGVLAQAGRRCKALNEGLGFYGMRTQ